MRKYLSENTFEGERKIYKYFADHKILLGPGESFLSSTPGFFRLVYSYSTMDILKLGLERFKEVFKELH